MLGLRAYWFLPWTLALSWLPKVWGIDATTVYRYKNLYVRGKTDSLLEDRYKGYWGRLESGLISLLCQELERHLFYTDSKSVSEWIKDTSGIVYTSAGMVDLLNPKSALLTRRLQWFPLWGGCKGAKGLRPNDRGALQSQGWRIIAFRGPGFRLASSHQTIHDKNGTAQPYPESHPDWWPP